MSGDRRIAMKRLTKKERKWARDKWGPRWAYAENGVTEQQIKERKEHVKQVFRGAGAEPGTGSSAGAGEAALVSASAQVWDTGCGWWYAVDGDHTGAGWSDTETGTLIDAINHALWYHHRGDYDAKNPMDVSVCVLQDEISSLCAETSANFAALPFVKRVRFVLNLHEATQISLKVTPTADREYVTKVAESVCPFFRKLVDSIPESHKPPLGFTFEVVKPDPDISFDLEGIRAICRRDAKKNISGYITAVERRAEKDKSWKDYVETIKRWAKYDSEVPEADWGTTRINETDSWARRGQHVYESNLPNYFGSTKVSFSL